MYKFNLIISTDTINSRIISTKTLVQVMSWYLYVDMFLYKYFTKKCQSKSCETISRSSFAYNLLHIQMFHNNSIYFNYQMCDWVF